LFFKILSRAEISPSVPKNSLLKLPHGQYCHLLALFPAQDGSKNQSKLFLETSGSKETEKFALKSSQEL
jgi:hypothetical protein